MKREAIRAEPISSYLCEVEGADLAGDARQRHGLCFRIAAVRSGNGGDSPSVDRAPDRADPRADETVSGDSGHVAAKRDEVQHLLHVGQALPGRQCDLCALLSGISARAHLRVRAGMDPGRSTSKSIVSPWFRFGMMA